MSCIICLYHRLMRPNESRTKRVELDMSRAFTKDDFVELVRFPGVVWQVAEHPKFNGGRGWLVLEFVGSDIDECGDRCRKWLGLSPTTTRTHATFADLVEANAMLVLALVSR